jgi:photosystem II stability/assembly factor-like uncharacterized protein
VKTHVFLLLLLCAGTPAQGKWDVIHDFGEPMSVVYFVKPEKGFAGSGWVSVPSRAVIHKTTDGGVTWSECPSPFIERGVVASISLEGNVGYAAIKISANSFEEASIWKTTDGGDSWFDFSPQGLREAVGVMDVGQALVLSTWNGGGWVNLPPSTVWNNDLPARDPQRPRTNGLASNGLDVVVTDFLQREWYSSDGGIQWQRSNNIPEAWSVYNLEGTRSFYAASEGDANDPERSIYRSIDGGASWQEIYRFQDRDMTFTGHIDGKGTRLYVQSALSAGFGMYRSDDLGLTWKAVGGPSGLRDTRFAVQGCGDIVYALDADGALFKTSDGGDASFVADGFFLGTPTFGKVGDTIEVPIFIRNIGPGTTISGTRLSLQVDEDLLSDWAVTNGSVIGSEGQLDLDIIFDPPLTDLYDKSKPVAKLTAINYLTTETTLELRLSTIDIASSSIVAPCGVALTTYMQLPSCGDATIRGVMLSEPEGIASITPSPVRSTARIETNGKKDFSLIVIDMLGRKHECIESTVLNASGLTAGAYTLVMMRDGRVIDRKNFLKVD